MIASDRKHPISAQKIEVLGTGAIVQILSRTAAKTHIVTDGPQNPHHLLVEMARMHLIAVGFVLGVKLRRIQARGRIAWDTYKGSIAHPSFLRPRATRACRITAGNFW